MRHARRITYGTDDVQTVVNSRLPRLAAAIALVAVTFAAPKLGAEDATQAAAYFPDRWTWDTREPAEAGLNSERLGEAIQFAKDHASTQDKDLAKAIAINISAEPFSDLIGPTKNRGDSNGIILKDGYIVAEWGDTRRVDMTFSVTKTYLSTTADWRWTAGCFATYTIRYRPTSTTATSTRRTTLRSPGTNSSTRPANGKARCGANRIGPTAGTAPCASSRTLARAGSITTCASIVWRWRCCTSGAARCRRCCAKK